MLKGKTAFVTGAGSGIGRETCLILAREGANVIAADINSESSQETLNRIKENVRKLNIQCDVTQKKSVEAALKKIVEEFKAPPTIIVNSAGILIKFDLPVLETDENDLQRCMNVNFMGSFLVLKVFAKALIDAKIRDASIINMESIAITALAPGYFAYSASKAALHALTKTAAKELGEHGIRVNALVPGYTKTEMCSGISEELSKVFESSIPLRRAGRPEEMGEIIAFLASSKCAYMAGSCLEIHGGAY